MRYAHTQTGPIHFVLLAIAILLGANSWFFRDSFVLSGIFAIAGSAFLFLGFCFRHLTVEDQGDHLGVRFGPLPVFGTRIPYETITGVEVGRSALVDGWGIHYVPGRGWTYNIWGFDCAVIRQGDRILRIGSDDVENLVRFLKGRVRGEM